MTARRPSSGSSGRGSDVGPDPELRLLRGGGLVWSQVPGLVDDVRALEAVNPGVRADLVIRLNVRRRLFRLYVTAPSRTPPDVVGLVFAAKDVSVPASEIHAAQDADIARAVRRAVDGGLWTRS